MYNVHAYSPSAMIIMERETGKINQQENGFDVADDVDDVLLTVDSIFCHVHCTHKRHLIVRECIHEYRSGYGLRCSTETLLLLFGRKAIISSTRPMKAYTHKSCKIDFIVEIPIRFDIGTNHLVLK